jgi:hypothetical protein
MSWAGLNKVETLSWRSFRDRLHVYFEQSPQRRQQLLFRGQRCRSFSLQTTLDRRFDFKGNTADRAKTNSRLLAEFKSEVMAVRPEVRFESEAIELLGRHFGLPSPLMDWTQSPYIASHFAFENAEASSEYCSIWVLDRTAASIAQPTIEIIDTPELIRFNARAISQRGVFVRAERDTRTRPLEDQFSDAIYRFDLKVEDRQIATAELDEMRVNSTTLFSDFDGAARTAVAGLLSERKS